MRDQKYTLISETDRYVPKFHLHGKRITFKINDPPKEVTELEWCEKAITDIVSHIKDNCNQTDQIGFSFTSDQFKEGAGYLQFKPCAELQSDDVWNVVFSLIQSNEKDGIKTTDTFRLNVTRVRVPTGKGRRRSQYYSTFEDEIRKRKGIIAITNDDNLCLPRALVVGKAHAEKNPLYKKIRQDTGKIQEKYARELMDQAGVVIPETGAGIAELNKFQDYLQNFKITVYQFGTKGREVIFEEKNQHASYKINLMLENDHYCVITSLTSAFVCNYYCENCHAPFEKKHKHKCKNGCKTCGGKIKCIKEREINCDDCKRDFISEICYKNHLENKICGKIKRCEDCLRTLNMESRKLPHVCGEIFCKLCHEYKSADHRCFIKRDTRKPPEDGYLFEFFDLETMQEKSHPENEELKIHEPNLCVAQKCCKDCSGDDDDLENKICGKCGERQMLFYGKDVIGRFMKHLMEIKKDFKTVCCISHNGGMFDVQFLLKYVLEKTRYTPNVIMRGTKVILLEIDNIRFVDSINFLPMGLAKLPKAFDLPPAIKKGYFPHFFNTRENQFYKGPMPDKKFYGVDSMFEEERSKFLKWYEEQINAGYVFDMHTELKEYCISDVDILRRACLKFRRDFLQEANVDPFLESLTLASACNLMFRRTFLQPNTIGLIPHRGYRMSENQSKNALKWIITEEMERGITIQHAGRGKEKVINGMKIDGFCEETNQVFEYHGCYWHGCPKTFLMGRDEPLHDDRNDTLNLRYQRTLDKIKKLKQHGYEVIEKWECQFWGEILKTNPNYLEDHPMIAYTPINPRDSFFGGRTGCTKLHYKAQEGEEIRYVDVCSLYPFICKTAAFAVGHPVVYVGEDCKKLVGDEFDLSEAEGLIKCKILPPQNLYNPVLPVKQNDKLLFSLCRTCGEMQNPQECRHRPEERSLTGTWVIKEVRKAVSKGYRIEEIFEIWQYDEVQYDQKSKLPGLFSDFINKFLKIKQEASGWPSHCVTEEEKNKYIEDFFETEGVKLEYSRIVNNPGLRSLAKLMLNSFWGRFGMKENQPQTSIINKSSEFFSLFANSSIIVNTVQEINDETILVNWQYREEVEEQCSTVNVVIAAYTTAQARLKLYEYLEALDRQVLYYDTDSVIYSYKPGQHEVKTGNFLGDMTDELEGYGPGSYIKEFVSGGPKTYAYQVFSPTAGKTAYVCKVKGLTLSFKASQLVNFDTLKKMIMNEGEPEQVIVKSTNILRTKEREVVTAPTCKRFQINVTKRRKVENYDTLPYGYKKQKIE